MPDDGDMIDEIMKHLPELSAEQKLQALRSDSLTLIIAIASIAALLGTVDTEETKSLPEEFNDWIQRLNEKVHNLRETLDKYTV